MRWTITRSLWICLALVLALCGALYAFLGMSASAKPAQPAWPHWFHGAVEMDGQPAPVGIEVEARGANVRVGIADNPVTVEIVGRYGEPDQLTVQGTLTHPVNTGTPIAFYVNGMRARGYKPSSGAWYDYYPYQSGIVTELDLYATGEYTLTAISRGCCPISVTYATTAAVVAAGTVEAFTNITGGVTVTLEVITDTYCEFGGWAGELWGGDLATTTRLITIPMRYDDATITAACGFYSVTVSSPDSAEFGDPGDWVIYDLRVSNAGGVTDTFDVTPVSSRTWTIMAPSTVGPLAAAETGQVDALVKIPQSAASCTRDVMTFTVTSRGDPCKSAAALLTTTVAGDCFFHHVFLPLLVRDVTGDLVD